MFQHRSRRFRSRPNDKSKMLHGGSNAQIRLRSNSFTNNHTRNNFKPSLSAEKLFEKYTSLAKEATSSGDITLSENYLQHADHFMRVIEDKNRIRNQNRVNIADKPIANNKNSSVDNTISQDNKIKN